MENKNQLRIQPRFTGEKGWMSWTGLGRNRARELGEQIGCVRWFGGRRLYDLKAADEYFDQMDKDRTEGND